MSLHYAIVDSQDPDTVAKRVTNMLRNGWHLQGGISVATFKKKSGTAFVFAQALTIDAALVPELERKPRQGLSGKQETVEGKHEALSAIVP